MANDYPDFQVPAATAYYVSTTGAPLLNLHTVLADGSAMVAAGTSMSLPAAGAYKISQISYEMLFSVSTAAGTSSLVYVELYWYDSVSGLSAGYQKFAFYAGTPLHPHTVQGIGPSGADQLNVVITAAANAVTAGWSLIQSSRPYDRHLWRTSNPAGAPPVIPGWTLALQDIGAGILLASSDVLAAGAAARYLLPLYTGDVVWSGRSTSGTAGDAEWRITTEPESGVFDTIPSLRISGQAGFAPWGGSSMEGPYTLPRVQCSHQSLNRSATTAWTLVAHMLSRQE